MNKKEVTEIKKQFTPSNCAITRICGCYVDGEKEKKTEMKDAFLSLPEEEMFKYFDIFRKSLSGTIGKNLLNMEFPLETESEGGTQEFLLKLRNSRLTDDALLEEFYNRVIDSYDYAENYLILLVHAAYDIPGKSTDGSEMFDASDEVYDYIMCTFCPVKLSKPGLSYHAEENSFHNALNDAWYTALVFQKIHPDVITPSVFKIEDVLSKKPIATKMNTRALLDYFEKSLERTLSAEEAAIIRTAYKLGKNRAFEKYPKNNKNRDA